MRARLTYFGYAAVWALVRWLPTPITAAAFRLAADVVWRRRGPSVLRLEANLRRVLGPQASAARLAELSRAGLRSYLRYWRETFALPSWSGDRIEAGFRASGLDNVERARAAGRGVVLVLSHSGNYDLAGAWLAGSGYPFTTVAERLRPERLFDRFVAHRQALGMEVLALTGGERTAFGVLLRRLRAGGVVCLVGDRDLSSGGVPVTFFGELASMPAGPATLALQTGAELLPAVLYYGEDGYPHADIQGPIAAPTEGERASRVRAMTQAVADALAAGIAAHPGDWHMLQRLWLADLDPRRRAAILARQGAGAASTNRDDAGEPSPN